MIRRALACAIPLLGAGCATVPVAPATGDWPARRAELQSLDDWSLKGRVAVAAGANGFSGGIAWRQQQSRADIELSGPMGGKALAIEVDGERFAVTDREGALIEGAEARDYVETQIGASLPVAELRYWLLGVPAPGLEYRETPAPDGSLQALEQAQWQVRYLRYAPSGPYALPSRIEMTTTGLRLKLSIAGWQLGR